MNSSGKFKITLGGSNHANHVKNTSKIQGNNNITTSNSYSRQQRIRT
jgi:hypothetical protein